MTGGGGHVDQADDDWVSRTAWGLPVRVVLLPEQPSLRLVHRRPPGFPVPGSVAPDLDVTAARIPCCRAVAWLAGDRPGTQRPLATAIPAGAEGWSAEQLDAANLNLGAHRAAVMITCAAKIGEAGDRADRVDLYSADWLR